MTPKGTRCKRNAGVGGKLCRIHAAVAQGAYPGPDPEPSDVVRGGIATKVASEQNQRMAAAVNGRNRKVGANTVAKLVVSEQARNALARLGTPIGPNDRVDPKSALMDTVRSAWQQRQVLESMLANVPEEDFDLIGTPPIPGSKSSSRGARVEVIMRNLSEATKNAARISKLAIDAGIEERLVRLAEEQSALIADTVRAAVIAAIGSLRLSPNAEAAAIQQAVGAAANHLRALAAGEFGDSAVTVIAADDPYAAQKAAAASASRVAGKADPVILEGIAQVVNRPVNLEG